MKTFFIVIVFILLTGCGDYYFGVTKIKNNEYKFDVCNIVLIKATEIRGVIEKRNSVYSGGNRYNVLYVINKSSAEWDISGGMIFPFGGVSGGSKENNPIKRQWFLETSLMLLEI